jgi:exosortase A
MTPLKPAGMEGVRPWIDASYRKGPWTSTLIAVAAYVGWLVAWYWTTLASMATSWYRYETYAHGFVVFPIAGWLVWRNRNELARLTPHRSTSWRPILLMLAAAGLWIAGSLADVLPARQFALITLLISGFWLIAGDAVARRMAFPLAFLYFAVPIGDFLLPTMIEWTADFTVAALRLSGVPVLREGMTFRIPSGSWSVIEACSGLRYLIASSMVGVLFAYLTYQSLSRRLAFVAASLVVPIIANWLRAYMIVMIGHLSDNRLAAGVDHILYGWVFFGIVIFLLFRIGSRWREDAVPTPAAQPHAAEEPPSDVSGIGTTHAWRVLIVTFAVAALPPLIIQLLHSRDTPDEPFRTVPPVLGEWRPVSHPLVPWTPEFTPPRVTIASAYERGAKQAGLYVAIYYAQDSESKLVSTTNELVRTSDRTAYMIADGLRTINTARGPFEVEESVVRIPHGRLLVHRWYWIDGVSTANALRAKFVQARARLLGRGDAGAIIVLYARLPEEGEAASAALDDMTRDAMVALPAVLQARLRGGEQQ